MFEEEQVKVKSIFEKNQFFKIEVIIFFNGIDTIFLHNIILVVILYIKILKLLCYFHEGFNAVETARKICEVYGPDTLKERVIRK